MKNKTIDAYLIGAILMLSVAPLVASYWLLDEVLGSATSLLVKPESQRLLESYRDDLKTLRKLDPQQEQDYKTRFMQASDELVIYQQPSLLQQVLRDTYLTYYLLLFVIVLILSLLIAIWLSKKVAMSYRALLQQDIDKAKKIQELSHFDEWQTIASKLAHELNNPLTPIEMMVSNLPRMHQKASPESFQKCLIDTNSIITEEITKLKDMVRHFSRFSKLPEVNLKAVSMLEYCREFGHQYQHAWPKVELSIIDHCKNANTQILLDNLLFNQCLLNMINNAVQANQAQAKITVKLTLSCEKHNELSLLVFNSGKPIKIEESEAIFQMYYSAQRNQDNMGLGLSIVKKIVLDHGGDIICIPLSKDAAFKITLPILTKKTHKPGTKSSKHNN